MTGTSRNIKLSSSQREVVSSRGLPLQVIACAGSGKTEAVSRRVAAIIEEGGEPESIIAFTFTEKAALELKDRIYERVEEIKGAEFLGRLGPMFVGTIHGYCYHLLQDHVPHFGNYDVLDDHRHSGILSREYKQLGLNTIGSKHWEPIRDFSRIADVIGNEMISPSALGGTTIEKCYGEYLEMLFRFKFSNFQSDHFSSC